MHTHFPTPERLSFAPAADRPLSPHALRFRTFRSDPSVIVVRVFGDVDASNTSKLACYVEQIRHPLDDVVLDLSGVDFFGTEGVSVLSRMNSGRGGPAGLAVVPSLAVTRLLRLCDPAPALLVAADVDVAVIMLLGHRRTSIGDA
jgi:anti-anti-sigma factor